MEAHNDPMFVIFECEENLATPGIMPGCRPDDRPRNSVPDDVMSAAADFQSFDCVAADPPSVEGREIGPDDSDHVEIVVEALRIVWPDRCEDVGRTPLRDLVEGAEFEPTERAAALDFTAELDFLAKGTNIANHGLVIYRRLRERHRRIPSPGEVVAEAKKTLPRQPEIDTASMEALLNAIGRLAADRGV